MIKMSYTMFFLVLAISCNEKGNFSSRSPQKAAEEPPPSDNDATKQVDDSTKGTPEDNKKSDATVKNEEKVEKKSEEKTKDTPDNHTSEAAVGSGNSEKFTVDAKEVFNGDVFFVLDTSGSMAEEMRWLESRVESFVKRFEQGSSAKFYAISNLRFDKIANFTVINQKINSHDSLDKVKSLIGAKKLTFQENGVRQFIFVTDDNANMKPADFLKFISSTPELKDRTSLNGIVFIDGESKENAECTKASYGTAYKTLAEDKTYGGLLLDLCKTDWTPLFEKLGQNLAKQVAFKKILKGNPDPKTLEIYVGNNKIEDANLYTYDVPSHELTIQRDKVAIKSGDEITVKYESKAD